MKAIYVNNMKTIVMIFMILVYGSFFWSVVGVFRQHTESQSKFYHALRLFSLLYWGYSVFLVNKVDELSTGVGVIVTFILFFVLLYFWTMSPVTKGNGFTLAFSRNLPTHLVKQGLYRHIRHPFYSMYLGTYITILWMLLDPILSILFLVLVYIYYVAARREEDKFLATGFRDEYLLYRQQAGMFFPKIFRSKKK